MNKYYRPALLLICLQSSLNYPVHATELEMSPELRESHHVLMELLAPEPVVNTGSDGVLTHLQQETPQRISDGRGIYLLHCATCHGTELQGQTNWELPDATTGMMPAPPHDDSGHTWHHADDQLFETVKYGAATAMGDPEYRSMMPAFKDALSDKEINSVLVFIRSTWSDAHTRWQQGANDAQSGRAWRTEQRDQE